MKKLVSLMLLLLPFALSAQTITEFKASNNLTYHIGDSVKLGKGSAPNGNFVYTVIIPGLPGLRSAFLMQNHNIKLDKTYANTFLVIRKIKRGKVRGVDKLWFVTDGYGGDINLYINDAIAACEVTPCETSAKVVVSVADEIGKLKQLLDSGALTQNEYDAQKKKLLN